MPLFIGCSQLRYVGVIDPALLARMDEIGAAAMPAAPADRARIACAASLMQRKTRFEP